MSVGDTRNYWLFQVMPEFRDELWPKLVNAGVAAQHYPKGWSNETRNINALKKLRKGDMVVAAFRGHRFAGYGTLTSDLYRDGDSLEIRDPKNNDVYEFCERFLCDWTIIPIDNDPNYIDCHDLKEKGFHDMDMKRGLCVAQISEETFKELKARLDKAGAQRTPPTWMDTGRIPMDEPEPPAKYEARLVRPIRDTAKTTQLKTEYAYRCQVCGERIEIGEGKFYAEVHHIRPLGREGHDVENNMLVLCPNHHAMFDLGIPRFVSDREIEIGQKRLRLKCRHTLSKDNIKYHNQKIWVCFKWVEG